MATALQIAGLLSALIFLISSIYEVVSLNHLYVSQQFLISLLLLVLALWAFIEVALIRNHERTEPVRRLSALLGLQIAMVALRHGLDPGFEPRASLPIGLPISETDLKQAVVFLPMHLVLFLAISRQLINAFSAAERLRANQLQGQMNLLKKTQNELQISLLRQNVLEKQQRNQLEQKLKTSLTAAAVVHEIQQPLNAILLNCQTARATLERLPAGGLPPMLLRSLQQLNNDSDQVVKTMERMRMLLRNVETEHLPLKLSDTISSTLLFLKRELEAEQVHAQVEGLEIPARIRGDGAQLQIALVNLIRNALQAMHSQPPSTRQLLVRLLHHPDRVELCVADSGPGFPEGYSNDTSWELLKSTKATGMGLGLFLAQTAASNHWGQLRIGMSNQLGGAEVVIELPILD